MPTELEYLAWLNIGDRRGIAYFFEQHYDWLVYWANKLIKDKAASEDIVSEVFIEVLDKGRTFDCAHGVKIYFIRAVRNRCLNYLKIKKRKEEGLKYFSMLDIDETVFTNNLIRAEILKEVKEEIDKLPRRLRQIFNASMEGLSVQQIAGQLGIKAQTVRSHLHRLIALIHEKVKNRF